MTEEDRRGVRSNGWQLAESVGGLDEQARAYHRHLMNALHQRLADAQQS